MSFVNHIEIYGSRILNM